MIKKISLLVLATILLATSSYAQDMSVAQASAQRDLLTAIDRLNKLRSDIADEKIPLSSRITRRENNILSLRNQAARVQAANDAKTIALEDIRNDLKQWEDENYFLVSLLDEYARRFENAVNITEREFYRNELDQFNAIDPNQVGEGRLSVQLLLIDHGFTRIRSAFDGDLYDAKVVLEDGILSSGKVARFGPLAYYHNVGKNISGMITAEDSNVPHLFTGDSGLSNITELLSGGVATIPIDVTSGKAISIESESDGLFEHIGKGGIWIIPILLFAGLSIIASILKIKEIYKIKLPEKGSLHQILSCLQSGDLSGAETIAAKVPYPVGEMLSEGIKHSDGPKELAEEIMYESMLDTQPKLEKYLPLIAISAATAPLLGLLGTVTGMINTFELITLFGTGDAQSLSSGISEALITTEFGLIVAIPALIMHALLSRKVQAIMTDMEKFAVLFVNGLPQARNK